MVNNHAPPGRNSKVCTVFLKPSGPHQRARRLGFWMAAKTASGETGRTQTVRNMDMVGSKGTSQLVMGEASGLWRFPWDVRLHKLGKEHQRFLPTHVAGLCRYNFRNALLHDVHFGSA